MEPVVSNTLLNLSRGKSLAAASSAGAANPRPRRPPGRAATGEGAGSTATAVPPTTASGVARTAPQQFAAFRRQLWDDFHIELPQEDVSAMVGHRIDENWRYLKARYDLPGSIETLVERRDALYRPILEAEAAPLPGVVAMFTRL